METAKKEAQAHLETSINLSQRMEDKSKQMLEDEDGIKLLGNCEIEGLAGEDLRVSIGAGSSKARISEGQMHLKE